jgi:hypothetical protein
VPGTNAAARSRAAGHTLVTADGRYAGQRFSLHHSAQWCRKTDRLRSQRAGQDFNSTHPVGICGTHGRVVPRKVGSERRLPPGCCTQAVAARSNAGRTQRTATQHMEGARWTAFAQGAATQQKRRSGTVAGRGTGAVVAGRAGRGRSRGTATAVAPKIASRTKRYKAAWAWN